MKLFGLSAAFAAAFVSSAAYAQDFPGARVEVNAGWDHFAGDLSYSDSDFPEDDFSVGANSDGVLYGISAGYDLPVGSGLYVGVEGNYDMFDNERCETLSSESLCIDQKPAWSLGGRLGSRFSPRGMIYAGAAYTEGKAELRYENELDGSNDFAESARRGGVRLSAGAEYRISANIYAKAEFRYIDYSDWSETYGSQRVTLGFDRNQIVAGLGVRF